MADMYFENLPNTTTPLIKQNLNKLNDVKVSPTEPSTGEKMWIKKGKNLIENYIKGLYYNSEYNTFYQQNDFACTEYIKIIPNTSYIFSNSLGTSLGSIHCFGNSHNYIETINVNTITTSFSITNTNVKYIVINIYDGTNIPNLSWVQLELGTTATTYEPYIEKEVYVKNDNGVYEEFISPDKKLDKIDNGENIPVSNIQGACWVKLATITFSAQGQSAIIKCVSGEGSNGEAYQNTVFEMVMKQGWSGMTYPISLTVNFLQNYKSEYKFKLKHLAYNIAEIYIYLPFNYNDLTYSITGVYASLVRHNERLDSEPTGDKNATVYVTDNGVYSTNEVRIGTWTDGKPVYRKVITTSEYIAPNSTINVAHNVSNLGIVFRHDATIYFNGSSIPVPSHYEEQNNNLVVQEINSTNIKVTTYNESWGNYTLYIILEYIKTTD